MKIEEIKPYEKNLRQWLLDNGFIKNQNLILDSYLLNFNYNNEIIINIQLHNQYVWIKDGENLSTIYNSDFQGNLTIEYLELLLKVILYKNK